MFLKIYFYSSFLSKDQNYELSSRNWKNVIISFKNSIKFETKYKFNDRLKIKMTSWIDSLIIRCVHNFKQNY